MNTIDELKKKAKQLRIDTLDKIYTAKQGHIGGCFSSIDMLVTLYYGGILKYDAKNPCWDLRDRFILSKGHNCVPLYLILQDLGFFSDEKLFCCNNSTVGYPNCAVNGIELITGALGHGLGVGAGMALASKLDKKDYNVFVLVGDGECYEGSTWEAAQFSSHHKLNNLIAIVDRNQQTVMGFTENYNAFEPLTDKWESFGWRTKRIDGNSFEQLLSTFIEIKNINTLKPTVIIADTIKGKGVSFMERVIKWHHGVPNEQEYHIARKELERS